MGYLKDLMVNHKEEAIGVIGVNGTLMMLVDLSPESLNLVK